MTGEENCIDKIVDFVGFAVCIPTTTSLIGSIRNNHLCYQDVMAIVRKYGIPDFLKTFTCNPEWNEIKLAIGNQNNRSDIMDRVLDIKIWYYRHSASYTDIILLKECFIDNWMNY